MFDRSLPIRKLLFRGERDKEKSLDCNICPVLKMSTGSLFFMFLKLEQFDKVNFNAIKILNEWMVNGGGEAQRIVQKLGPACWFPPSAGQHQPLAFIKLKY